MPKLSSIYICQQCGFRTSQFLGKCPECGTWNSLVEEVIGSSAVSRQSSDKKRLLGKSAEIINLADVEKQHHQRLSTGIGEFDRVLGGGIVPGSVVLVSGDPGIGKSTLLLQLALNYRLQLTDYSLQPVIDKQTKKAVVGSQLAVSKHEVLYIAGEESARQIKIRADRILKNASLAVLNETDIDIISEVINTAKPGLLIVDSIQTMETPDLNSVAGSVSQVRECAHRLERIAKLNHIPMFLVGHVNKEGSIAGPKTLEHLVDVVLSLEGDSNSNFRVLRASKNRFGPTDEVGVFEMGEIGMMEVNNPSKLFLEAKVDAPGSVVIPTMNGLRPILVEVQALVTKSFLPIPRRTSSGIDNNRLQLLIAVLAKRLGLPLYDQDIFVNVTGGLKVIEPAADLGIALAIISSFKDKTLAKTAVVGEIGLLGEIRAVRGLQKRVAEAKKLGFTAVISPENAKSLTEAAKLALK